MQTSEPAGQRRVAKGLLSKLTPPALATGIKPSAGIVNFTSCSRRQTCQLLRAYLGSEDGEESHLI